VYGNPDDPCMNELSGFVVMRPPRLTVQAACLQALPRMGNLLWIIIVVLIIAWLGGFAYGVGNLIHILLVIAVILLIVRLVSGRRVL
jgi:predicted ferric reductase